MPSPKNPSEKVLARRAAKVVMNREALDAMQLGMADGLLEIGERILAAAVVLAPRDPEAAERRGVPMMADTGIVGVWALGKKVGGTAQAKPRALGSVKNQVVLFVGFQSRLAHLNELGTVNMNAQPFLTPAFNSNVGGAADTVLPAIGKRVKAVR